MSRKRTEKKQLAAETARKFDEARKKGDSVVALSGAPAAPGIARRIPELLLAGQLAIIVASALIPSEGAIPEASHLILMMLQLILFAATAFSNVQSDRPFRFGVEDVLLVLGGLCVFLSYYFRFDEINGRLANNALWVWLFLLTAFLTLRRLLVTDLHRRMTAVVLIGLAVGLAMHGLYQTTVTFPQQRAAYRANPEQVLAEAGVNAPEGSVLRVQFENRLNSLEPFSTYALTNSLAGVLAAAICVLTVFAGLQLVEPSHNGKASWKKAIPLAVLIAILLFCFFLTKSRTAFLAVGVTLLVALGWVVLFRRGVTISPMLLGGVAVAVVAVAGVVALAGGLDLQVLSEAPLSVRYRFEYWESSAALVRQHPLLGVGPGNFQIFYTHTKLPQASETISDPHNFLVEMAANFGLPGCLLIFAALVWAAVTAARSVMAKAVSDATDAADNVGKWIIFSGAVLGLMISIVAGALVNYMPPWDVVPFLAIGFGAAYLVFDQRGVWNEPAQLAFAALCGALVLVLHLLASGGISFPGVAMMLWAWLAVALPKLSSETYDHAWLARAFAKAKSKSKADTDETSGESESASDDPEEEEGYQFNPHQTTWVVSGAIGLMLVAGCYLYVYSPVLQSRAALERATYEFFEGDTKAGRASVEEAANYDPYWVEPWNAEFMIAAEMAEERNPNTDKLKEIAEEIRKRGGPNSNMELGLGYGWLGVYRKTGYSPALKEAVAAFEKAVEYYPADAFTRAELAWSYHLNKNETAAKEAACRALELDDQHPHAERKLQERFLQDPELKDANARRQMEQLCGKETGKSKAGNE